MGAFIGAVFLWFDGHFQHAVGLVREHILSGLDTVKAEMLRHQCFNRDINAAPINRAPAVAQSPIGP